MPVPTVISYVSEDERFREELEKHLAVFVRQGVLVTWDDHELDAGADWQAERQAHIEEGRLFLLVVSPDYLAAEPSSGRLGDEELKGLLERHAKGSARVIPVIVRPCLWRETPLGRLEPLPEDGAPVDSRSNRDDAWLDVAFGIREAAAILEGKAPPPRPNEPPAVVVGGKAPGKLTINAVRVTPGSNQCTVDFWVSNGGGSDVLVLAADFEVMETARAEAVKGPMRASETYNLDLTDLTKPGQHGICPTSQLIAPGQSDRFAFAMTARLGLGVVGAWRLRPTFRTNFGDVQAEPIEVWLPFVGELISFSGLVASAKMEEEQGALDSAMEAKDGERLVEILTRLEPDASDAWALRYSLTTAAADEQIAAQVGEKLLLLCSRLAEKVKDATSSAELWAACARLLRASGRTAEASEHLKRALRASPEHPEADDWRSILAEISPSDAAAFPAPYVEGT